MPAHETQHEWMLRSPRNACPKTISEIFRKRYGDAKHTVIVCNKTSNTESRQCTDRGVCRQKRSAAKHLKISRCIYSEKYVWDILKYLRHIFDYLPCIFNFLRELFYRGKLKIFFFARGKFYIKPLHTYFLQGHVFNVRNTRKQNVE